MTVTSTPNAEIRQQVGADVVYVFVPTSPNPTSGFLLIVHEAEVLRLKMSVEEGIKLVISGGIVSSPEDATSAQVKKPARHPPKVAGKGS